MRVHLKAHPGKVSKKKLIRLAELETFQNVYQLRKDLKGKWNQMVFRNQHSVTLELACGKGEYSLALARRYPQRNFIGIDIKGARMWRGAKTAQEEKLNNVVFLRTFIDHLTDYFEPGEVEEIWILFPDPYHKKSKAGKRLTSPDFLNRYKKILSQDALIHLKTDDLQLFQFTVETLARQQAKIIFQSLNLYADPLPDEMLSIKTFYELKHLAEKKIIRYIKFTLPLP